MIRPIRHEDAAAITGIYNHYITETTATFEKEAVSAAEMLDRIKKIAGYQLPWLIAEDVSGQLAGYAYATRWNNRSAYNNSVEISVYLSPQSQNKGLGTQLYQALFSQLKMINIHVIIGGITLPNPNSIRLHEKFGMTKVAHFSEVGYKFDRWLDVGYWQKVLNSTPS